MVQNQNTSEVNTSSRRALLKATALSAAALSLTNTSAALQTKTGNPERLDELIQGNQSIAKVYNRVLSQSEVQQNFNALRGRYGI